MLRDFFVSRRKPARIEDASCPAGRRATISRRGRAKRRTSTALSKGLGAPAIGIPAGKRFLRRACPSRISEGPLRRILHRIPFVPTLKRWDARNVNALTFHYDRHDPRLPGGPAGPARLTFRSPWRGPPSSIKVKRIVLARPQRAGERWIPPGDMVQKIIPTSPRYDALTPSSSTMKTAQLLERGSSIVPVAFIRGRTRTRFIPGQAQNTTSDHEDVSHAIASFESGGEGDVTQIDLPQAIPRTSGSHTSHPIEGINFPLDERTWSGTPVRRSSLLRPLIASQRERKRTVRTRPLTPPCDRRAKTAPNDFLSLPGRIAALARVRAEEALALLGVAAAYLSQTPASLGIHVRSAAEAGEIAGGRHRSRAERSRRDLDGRRRSGFGGSGPGLDWIRQRRSGCPRARSPSRRGGRAAAGPAGAPVRRAARRVRSPIGDEALAARCDPFSPESRNAPQPN